MNTETSKLEEIKQAYARHNETKEDTFALVIHTKSKEFGESLVNSMQANKSTVSKTIKSVDRCGNNGEFYEKYMLYFKKNIQLNDIESLFSILPIEFSQIEIH